MTGTGNGGTCEFRIVTGAATIAFDNFPMTSTANGACTIESTGESNKATLNGMQVDVVAEIQTSTAVGGSMDLNMKLRSTSGSCGTEFVTFTGLTK